MFNQTTTTLNTHKSVLAFIGKALLGSGIMAISAQITIPLPFVPITGQTLGLTIIALSMGSKVATGSIALYLLEGALGLPVFALGSFGVMSLLGPSGGYLWGFLPAAYLIGLISEKKLTFLSAFVAGSVGTAVVFASGLIQLSFFVPLEDLLSVGLYPFLVGGLIKIILATLAVPSAHRLFSKIK